MRRHYRSAQRLGALCLCLALCVGMLYLCERTIAFAESPVEEGEQAPDEGVFDLWDPSITAELTAMPPEAFDEPTARLAGFSPDGRKALISYCSESYLYDLETGERTALRIGDDMTVEALRAEAQYQLYGLSEEKAAEKKAEFDAMDGPELLRAVANIGSSGSSTIRAESGPGFSEKWMSVRPQGTSIFFALDTDSGKLYSWPQGQYLAAREGKLLLAPKGRFSEELLLRDEISGECTALPPYESGYQIAAASFLPEGGVAALLRSAELDLDRGQHCQLVLRPAEGQEQSIDLGRIQWALCPDVLLCPDGENFLLSCSQRVPLGCCLVLRSSGQLSCLGVLGAEITEVPVTFGEDGVPAASADAAGCWALATLENGKTVLFQGTDMALYLYRPETGESRVLLEDLNGETLPPLMSGDFTFSGKDRLWCFAAPRGQDWRDLYIRFWRAA